MKEIARLALDGTSSSQQDVDDSSPQVDGFLVGNWRHSQDRPGASAVAYPLKVKHSIVLERRSVCWAWRPVACIHQVTQFLGILTVTQFTEKYTQIWRSSVMVKVYTVTYRDGIQTQVSRTPQWYLGHRRNQRKTGMLCSCLASRLQCSPTRDTELEWGS